MRYSFLPLDLLSSWVGRCVLIIGINVEQQVYPSIIATAIITWAIWKNVDSIGDILLGKRYWFIGCILIYYILLYPIKVIKDGLLAPYFLGLGGGNLCTNLFCFLQQWNTILWWRTI